MTNEELDDALVRVVEKFWNAVPRLKGISLAQATFYAEQEFDVPVAAGKVRSALRRLAAAGRLQSVQSIQPVNSINLETGDETKSRSVIERYFPVTVA